MIKADLLQSYFTSSLPVKFFVPNIGEYYSYKIDIIPKMEYNVLESEVYSLCI